MGQAEPKDLHWFFRHSGDNHVRFSLIENKEPTRQALRGIKALLAKAQPVTTPSES